MSENIDGQDKLSFRATSQIVQVDPTQSKYCSCWKMATFLSGMLQAECIQSLRSRASTESNANDRRKVRLEMDPVLASYTSGYIVAFRFKIECQFWPSLIRYCVQLAAECSMERKLQKESARKRTWRSHKALTLACVSAHAVVNSIFTPRR